MTAFLSPATKDDNKPNLFVSILKGDISLPQKDVMRLSSLLLMMSFQEQQVNNKQRLNIVKILRNLRRTSTTQEKANRTDALAETSHFLHFLL